MRLKETYERQMKSLLGEAGFFAYLRAMEAPFERGLRMNFRLAGEAPSAATPFCGEAIPWARGAYFVREGTRPGLSSLHEAGLFYLQEPSAMAPVSVLDPQPGERVLDLCAAPGGKSTQIVDCMEGRGVLLTNELIPSRAEILSRNLERMGVRNAVVTSADAEALAARFPAFFDRVLVDAPCSGEGLFRRQPEAMEEWDEGAPARCAARQLDILHEAAKMLRPGGVLVYSTCTFNRRENEDVIEEFLRAHSEYAPEGFALPGLPAASAGMLHLFPHEIRGEGHFVARLRRKGDAPGGADLGKQAERMEPSERMKQAERIRASRRGMPRKAALPEFSVPGVFAGDPPAGIVREGNHLRLPPKGIGEERLQGIRVLRKGLQIATICGRLPQPDHALAMAMLKEEAARSFELTEEQARLYQAGEALSLGDLPAGFTLLCLHGKPLGWGKQAGGVMKNHYPKGLRRRG